MISEIQRQLYVTKVNKCKNRISRQILTQTQVLEATFAHSEDPVPFTERTSLSYKPISEGEKWGNAWNSAWFQLKGKIPSEWQGQKVVAQLDFNGEAMVIDEAGLPLQGLTNGSVFAQNFSRDLFPLMDKAEGGEDVSLWVEAAANQLFGINKTADPDRDDPNRHGTYTGQVNKIRIATFDTNLWQLWLDLEVLIDLHKALPADDTRGMRLLYTLNKAMNAFAENPENTTACREILKPLLDAPANASAVTAIAVGHAHIDTGWLWPVRETIRKSARTFSSQLALIEDYPDYIFGASQPAHYAMIKQHYPALYEKIKKAVASGQWELQGGMWVEADCNVISGESMVRQFLHGKNFFMDEFGVDVKNLWIPDVFGYSASIPQIMKRAGVNYFLTQKLSWSQFNKFPNTTFMWRGIDGSSVLTHFPPENTYNSALEPGMLRSAETNFKEKAVLDEMMVLFGVGDGGGGPKAEHIEKGIRQENLEGVPKVQFGRADDFFARISASSDTLPVWSGELYLELHRGTLTTQSRTKRGNRKLEQALRATEYLLSCGNLSEYPQDVLDKTWKIVLLNQFHDIIPGSSINWVYQVTEREHQEALDTCKRLQADAIENLLDQDENCLTLINTTNITQRKPIILPEGWTGAEDVPCQKESDGTVVALKELPPQSVACLTRSDDAEGMLEIEDLVLENDLIRYEFKKNGEIARAFDKTAKKEVLRESGNILTLYEDRPNNWDAWDVDIFYEDQALETANAVETASLGRGPVRQGILFKTTIGESSLLQKIYLATNSKRLDFETEVDWHERHKMLRVSFATSIRSDEAIFDIQYGYAKRPTHRNTSWDMARFEVAAHKYADLSDNDYGVALLNDCKYGHKILDNTMDLNLLRSPTNPDPDADQGNHTFTYSLLPHEGPFLDSQVIAESIQLNHPPLCFAGHKMAKLSLPVTVSGHGVALEALKKAEKNDDLIVRVVEQYGKETSATIELESPDATLVEVDLMEWNELQVFGKQTAVIPMRPFEIRTFAIRK